MQRNRGLQLELLRFLDQRADPVNLAARAASLVHALDNLGAAALTDESSCDRSAPGWHLVDDRYVEIGVEAHRQRTRDRRGAHHQLMRIADAFLPQCEPLRDAEPMLFIDDGEPEPRQRHLVLEQHMGADRELRFAAFDRRLGLPLRLRGKTARQPGDLQGQAVEPRRELAIVLLGEDFGRRHECDLIARLDGLQRRQRRDHRLAAADVALQEPLHRLAFREVAPDLRDDALLRPGQGERKPRVERASERRIARQTRCPAPRPRTAVDLERKLLRDKLVELEPRPRRMRALVERCLRGVGGRLVQVAHGFTESPQPPRLARPGRQRFGEICGIAHERPMDELAQCVLREAGGRRIHRRQSVR